MRDNLIDSIKAFAIILVILGHSIQFNIPENFDSDLGLFILSICLYSCLSAVM